eukprot:scaffold15022_cov117-Isochrysis_galbana.AAC.4
MSAPATAAANAAAEADVKMAARLRTYGLCLALAGVIIVSPDSLMLRCAARVHALQPVCPALVMLQAALAAG